MPEQGETKYKKEFDKIAYNLLKKGKSMAAICVEFDISRETLYTWIKPESQYFKESLSDSINKGRQASQLWWEDQMQNSLHLPKGESFNTTAWIFTMKNRFAEDYRDKVEAEINTKGTFGMVFKDE